MVGLVAVRHLNEHALFDVGVEELCLHFQHVHLVVQLHRDYEHHADALEPAHGSEGAAAVDGKDLRKSLHDESTLVGTAALNLNTHLLPTTLCPAGTEVIGTRLKTPCLFRLVISLSFAVFQRATWGRPMTSLKVFGTRSDSPSPKQLGCVLVMV